MVSGFGVVVALTGCYYGLRCGRSSAAVGLATTRAVVSSIVIGVGIDYAILGPEELSSGDAARRLGNEYLFQMLAQQNIETMNGYGVKKIVTNCPHVFNTLANEYPESGGEYEVVHGTQLVAEQVTPLLAAQNENALALDPLQCGRSQQRFAVVGFAGDQAIVRIEKARIERRYQRLARGGADEAEDIGAQLRGHRVARMVADMMEGVPETDYWERLEAIR